MTLPKLDATAPKSGPAYLAAASSAPAPRAGGTLPQFLSIDELMQWVTATVTKTDVDLLARMDRMTAAKEQQAAVGRLVEQLSTAKSAGGELPAKETLEGYASLSPAAKKVVDDLYAAATPKTETRPAATTVESLFPYKVKLKAEDQALVDAGVATFDPVTSTLTVKTGGSVVDKDKLSDAISSMQQELGALQSTNELDMIKLQSAISARGQAIQMVSNMIKQMDDTSRAIVGNVR